MSFPIAARQSLQIALDCPFWVGHFSRLSHWKGQHVLLSALALCPSAVGAIFVGDALFQEDGYAQQLRQQVIDLNLQARVRFLGFRADVAPLMRACNLIAHTSTAPEPFGRVIVEGMLCDRPVVAAAAGGALEIIKHDQTGWLTPPGDAAALAAAITACYQDPDGASAIARRGQLSAQQRFNLNKINAQYERLFQKISTCLPAIAPEPVSVKQTATWTAK